MILVKRMSYYRWAAQKGTLSHWRWTHWLVPWSGMIATVNQTGDVPLDKQGSGLFYYAINIDSFVPLDEFTEEIDREIHVLRSSPPAEGFDQVYFPGELEAMKHAQWSKN